MCIYSPINNICQIFPCLLLPCIVCSHFWGMIGHMGEGALVELHTSSFQGRDACSCTVVFTGESLCEAWHIRRVNYS